MNGLALCAGSGALELGVKLAIGDVRTVGYVEREAYAAATLVARMGDSLLDRAPVWDDLESFDGLAWRGHVDLITAGFPCQPASHAGRRAGTGDERWIWPLIARIIGAVAPRLVFLENVRGLLSVNDGAGFHEVISSLSALGYDAEWDCFSASEVGAPHGRQRLFVLAHADEQGLEGWDRAERGSADERAPGPGGSEVGDSAHADGRRRIGGEEAGTRADQVGRRRSSGSGGVLGRPFPPGPDDRDAWIRILAERPDLAPAVEPAVRGVVDGMAYRVDRLRLTGNGVVPMVAATAFVALADRAGLLKERK
ncbi:MAG: DNA cytosine methyltransferase [Solirubrobacterales bacterium]